MQRMPDDVMLEVMQYLNVPDLLACRLVCKRLTELALHPGVWRHQRLYGHDSRCYACAVLTLAPCLKHLDFHVTPNMKDCHHMFATTKSAAAAVTVNMGRSRLLGVELDGGSAAHAALVIRNQERLGRMRSLTVHLVTDLSVSDASVVIRTVASTAGLVRLYVYDFPLSAPSMAGLHRSLPTSSLKYFGCDLSPESEAFCDLVLTTHAATLEQVCLGTEATLSASTGTLLGGLRNLRRLTAGALRGLEAAAACESLTDVTLYMAPGRQFESRCRSTAAFLRGATQLRKLHLDYFPGAVETAGDDTDLVLALGASGQSRLETLEISNELEGFPQMRSLLASLPRLPALQCLDVMAPVPDQFLMSITPGTAPALRTLEVFSSSVCAHHFLHRNAVQKVLSLNPLLKLFVYLPTYCRKSDLCKFCARGCHQVLADHDPSYHDDMTEDEWSFSEKSVLIPRSN